MGLPIPLPNLINFEYCVFFLLFCPLAISLSGVIKSFPFGCAPPSRTLPPDRGGILRQDNQEHCHCHNHFGVAYMQGEVGVCCCSDLVWEKGGCWGPRTMPFQGFSRTMGACTTIYHKLKNTDAHPPMRSFYP